MHVFEALSSGVFSKEASWNTFSSISVNVNKKGHNCVGNYNEDNIVPPIESTNSQICEDMAKEVGQRYKENCCSESVVFDYIISANEHSWWLTVIVTGSSGVAECLAWKIDVTVSVSSDDIEEVSPASAFVFTESSCFIAASPLVAGEQLD